MQWKKIYFFFLVLLEHDGRVRWHGRDALWCGFLLPIRDLLLSGHCRPLELLPLPRGNHHHLSLRLYSSSSIVAINTYGVHHKLWGCERNKLWIESPTNDDYFESDSLLILLLQGQCCSDGVHCCEYGYTCDLSNLRCRKGFTDVPSGAKKDAKRYWDTKAHVLHLDKCSLNFKYQTIAKVWFLHFLWD